jgi:hypothetical protein
VNKDGNTKIMKATRRPGPCSPTELQSKRETPTLRPIVTHL